MTLALDGRGFAAQVDTASLMRDLEQLARWQKLAGTPAELESLRFVQDRMQAHGYRTELLLHDAYISLPGPARAEVDGVALHGITHSMARASPPGGVTGPLVDVGEGTEADITGRDLRGTILLVEGIASPAVALRAARAGAIGQLHISPHEHIHEMCISPVWGSPDPETMQDLPCTVVVSVAREEGMRLRERLGRGEVPAVTLHAAVDTGWRQIPLLVASLDAPDPQAPFILFSGHHDTWYEGVMDNGAANTTMLEVARLAAPRRASWRRGLRFCFWSGHSQGRYAGSAWYADTHWAELEERCAVHVNVDSTGGIGATVMGEATSASSLIGFAGAVLAKELGVIHEGRRQARNGDQSFWGIGIPGLFCSLSQQPPGPVRMRNPLGWWWHTPDDLLDKIDPEFLARDTRVYAHAIWRLLTDPALPLDHATPATALLAELRACATPATEGLGLHRLIAAVEALATRLRDSAWPDAVALRIARALVPLDYTTGDRFAHDPALPQPPWPVLEPLRRLAEAEAGSDAAHFLTVSGRRSRNRVEHAVRQAAAALAGA